MERSQGSEERLWAMACHLAALTGIVTFIGFIVGPLVLWALKKDEYPLVDDQGKESMNFQISMLIYALLLLPSILVFLREPRYAHHAIFIPLLFLWGVTEFVFVIVASIRASNGKRFRYPLTIRFVR